MAKILIVDDDKNYRSSLRRLLTDLDYDVIVAENGDEAISTYTQSPADIVITDIFMPEKDGLEVIIELKKKFQDSKIIAISGGSTKFNVSLNLLEQAKQLGAHTVIEKPFRNEQLVAAIKNIIGTDQ
ncbi:MAG: response regulator [Thermodesulfovibrionia bacterium]|nr:response regulator [Thermodesulfovibrionia bacterium]